MPKIGNVEIPNRLVLGPMAGVTDLAFHGQRQGFVLSGQEDPGPFEAVSRGASRQRPDFRQ